MEVAATAPGERVPVEVLRDGTSKTLDVKVKELPGSDKLASNDASDSDKSDTLQGVGVERPRFTGTPAIQHP